MKSSLPTIKQIHEAFVKRCGGEKTTPEDDMIHNCYAVACVLSEMLKEQGRKVRAVYGFWHGKSVITRGVPMHRHGWVECEGMILDPTRFAFEGEKAYLFVASKKDCPEYDEGMRQFRIPRPFPKFDPKSRQVEKFDWSPQCASLLQLITKTKDVSKLSFDQMMWLANHDFLEFGECIHEIYDALNERKLGALIPIDYQNYEEEKRAGNVT